MPEFSKQLTRRVTIFGAESTGKTTLASSLASIYESNLCIEYARPYLENTSTEITREAMTNIWKGQKALQQASKIWEPRPFIIQDTDLFSTIGYWEFPHWQNKLGPVPLPLYFDAYRSTSDLYLITPSNIPFEADPLRYGGDVREGTDEYWINIAKRNRLNYRVLTSTEHSARLAEAMGYMAETFAERVAPLTKYERVYN
jgi:nicotinamide riboside kinase